MNVILLLFVLIASLFTGSGISNMLSVAGGLDHFYEIAGAGDMIMIFSGKSAESDTKKLVNKCAAVKSAGVEKVYLYSDCVENNGVELKSSSPAFISINDTAEKIFNENNEMITSVDEGHIYLNKSFMDINDINSKVANKEIGGGVNYIITVASSSYFFAVQIELGAVSALIQHSSHLVPLAAYQLMFRIFRITFNSIQKTVGRAETEPQVTLRRQF